MLLTLLTLPLLAAQDQPTPRDGLFFVATNGDDAWTGRLSAPNAAKTDGPFATLARARDAARTVPAEKGREIVVRGGTYYLAEPLTLGPEDSGLAGQPLVIRSYPGEQAVLSGGRPVTGWRRKGDLWAAPGKALADAGADFRQLRVGDEMQLLARHPNYEPDAPTTGGWLFAKLGGDALAWQTSMTRTHTPGDWIEWEVDAPAAGDYVLWLYYAHNMKRYNRPDMDHATVFQIDGGDDVPLVGMPDTGDWSKFTWGRCATLSLTAGKHRLRWTNRKGGGLNFNAYALCDDPTWQPAGIELTQPAGKHLLVVQAEQYAEAKGKEMGVQAGQNKGKPDELPVAEVDLPEWDLTGAQVMIFPAWGWVGGPVQIGGVDRAKRLVKLTGQNAQQDIRPGNRFYFQNVREALDAPGEFYYDAVAGELLYLPRSADFAKREVVTPVLDRLLEIQGDAAADTWPEWIELRGLQFRDSRYSSEVKSLYQPDDAALRLDHARHVDVVDCKFDALGGYGVGMLNLTAHCRVLHSTFEDLGQGGVIVHGDGPVQPHDIVVAGCEMRRLGTVYKHVAGVYVTTGSKIRVSHCSITDVPRYGISFKSYNGASFSHDCIAEYNEILRSNLETNDTGAIETLGRDRKPSGNIIRYNLILDVVGMKHQDTGGVITPYYTWGIYLDDYSSGTHIYGNVVARTVRGSYHNHLGFDNLTENNIFVDGLNYQAEYNGNQEMKNNVFRRNVVVFSNPEAVYQRSGGWHQDVLTECNHNLLYWSAEDLATSAKPVTPQGTFAQWQAAGYDTDSIVAEPRFKDAAHDDYHLAEDSPAWKLGFEAIPLEQIGPGGYLAEKP